MNTTEIRKRIARNAKAYKGRKLEKAAHIIGAIRTREYKRYGKFLED
jgi:hypothetical protein